MHTAYITHPECLKHDMGSWHPESPLRLRAIDDRLHAAQLFDYLLHREAPLVHRSQLLRAHDAAYIDSIEAASPYEGFHALDPDTGMNPHSLDAAYHAAGGAVMAVDLVMRGEVANAFVACRPPGHHATRSRAMGFCIFNNVAVAAAHALEAHGLERVTIVDFDVHHGNGTEDIFRNDPRAMLCSTFQHPFYPFCGADTASGHIVNVPLPAGTTGSAYRAAFSAQIMPRLKPSGRRCCFSPPDSTPTARTTWASSAWWKRIMSGSPSRRWAWLRTTPKDASSRCWKAATTSAPWDAARRRTSRPWRVYEALRRPDQPRPPSFRPLNQYFRVSPFCLEKYIARSSMSVSERFCTWPAIMGFLRLPDR